jgi:hypothetical protein
LKVTFPGQAWMQMFTRDFLPTLLPLIYLNSSVNASPVQTEGELKLLQHLVRSCGWPSIDAGCPGVFGLTEANWTLPYANIV